MIDVTMTATLRPGIVSQTLDSFCRNIFKDRDNYRLIINVDPVGEKIDPIKVLEVCKQYFKNIIFNSPKQASFPTAVIWCWSKTTSDFIFHLEDDWLLTSKIDINDMIRILNLNENLVCLRLPKCDIPKSITMKLWKAKYFYTGDNYFVTSSNNQFGLNPVLIKREFIKEAVQIMSLLFNPEKQFRPSKNERMNNLINKWKYGLYGVPGQKATVLDNGTVWRQKNNFKKPQDSFLVWERS
jgi:hypothetical protein